MPFVFWRAVTDSGTFAHSCMPTMYRCHKVALSVQHTSTKLGTQITTSLFVASSAASMLSDEGTFAGDCGLNVVKMVPMQGCWQGQSD